MFLRTAFLLATGSVALAATPVEEVAPPVFSPQEIGAIRAYWAVAGRHAVTELPWTARQTVEGSVWLREYFGARTSGKVNPGQAPSAQDEFQKRCDAWLDKKIAYDWATAELTASQRNGQGGRAPGRSPGPAPAGMDRVAGPIPNFATVCRPQSHTLKFHDGTTLEYETYVKMRPDFAYFRHPEGVRSFGQRVKELPERERNELFKAAELGVAEQRVFNAVSLLEGGFDSVNTYDTGFVSVGFIQFASLTAGGHSLGQVLLRLKRDEPRVFEDSFRRFGLEVSDDGLLMALDLASGQVKTGPDANAQIIADKRLIAAFQRAGLVSREFRVAQIQTARDLYYPADDMVTFTANGQQFKCRIGDIFKTEAGLATLMDRKVNTGKYGNLAGLLTQAMEDYGMDRPEECSQLEWLLTQALVYRKNYLTDASLSQPRRVNTITTSRGGTRNIRPIR